MRDCEIRLYDLNGKVRIYRNIEAPQDVHMEIKDKAPQNFSKESWNVVSSRQQPLVVRQTSS